MFSFRKKSPVITRDSLPYKRTFLQPLAVAIVCAILVTLIFVMGYMDIRRSESNLVGFMEDQALSTVSVLQRLTEENLRSITAATDKKSADVKTARHEEADYSKKWVIESLTEFGSYVDVQWKKGKVNNDYLKQLAADNNFWYLAVLDIRGQAVYQSSELPKDALANAGIGSGDRKLTTIEKLEKIRASQGIGFLALRRKDNSGTVIINLDKSGLIYWSLKVAVEKGVQKIGDGHGIVYVQIIDEKGRQLSSVGKSPLELSGNGLDYNNVLAGKAKIASRKTDSDSHKILDMAAPLFIDKKIVGVVRIGLERGSMDTIIAENRKNIFIFVFFVGVIALLSMLLLYYDQNKHLAGIIEMERRLEKAERLSSLGKLAAGVAHEIRNPLNAISIATQRLKRDFIPADAGKTEEFKNLSTVIRDEIRRLNGIIEEFLTFSKSRKLEFSNYSAVDLLQKIVSLINEEAATRGVVLETRWRYKPAIIPMDVNKLQQSFLNLIKNAMESIPAEGKIIITLDKEGKDYIIVSINDNGCGMTAEEVERIFSPEYTTKEKGLGLGVPLATEIIRGHGGEIRVTSRKDEGTTFEAILPRERIKQ